MPYTYHTDEDRRAMLAVIGVKSEDELIDVIPEKFHLRSLLPIEKGRTEPETQRAMGAISRKNRPAAHLVNFLGGGIYEHTVPSAVNNLASRPEFATAYTPYQPEASQGTLQVIFEFQTHISRPHAPRGGECIHVRRRHCAGRSHPDGVEDHAPRRGAGSVCAQSALPESHQVVRDGTEDRVAHVARVGCG
jgi:hypothetical protein